MSAIRIRFNAAAAHVADLANIANLAEELERTMASINLIENASYLRAMNNHEDIMVHTDLTSGVETYVMPSMGVRIPRGALEQLDPFRFRLFFESQMVRLAEERSMYTEAPRVIRTVLAETGKTFRWSKATATDHNQCTICLNEFKTNNVVRSPCGNDACVFHKRCINRWFKKGSSQCPNCRFDCAEGPVPAKISSTFVV